MKQSTGLKNLENSKCDVGYGTGMVDMLVIYFRSDKAYLNRNHKSFSRPFFFYPQLFPLYLSVCLPSISERSLDLACDSRIQALRKEYQYSISWPKRSRSPFN